MNRADVVRQTLMWEAAGKQAYQRAKAWRARLDADARAELDEQGTAPTWRLPDLATVTLPVSRPAAYVGDDQALLKWVEANHPEQVEHVKRVRPGFLGELLGYDLDVDGGVVHDGEGTVIPGLSVRPGGVPQALTFRPTRDARAELGEAAQQVLDLVASSLYLPAPPEPPAEVGEVSDAA